jgi:hypothetical protein
MTMDAYLAERDAYRFGNAAGPRLDQVRLGYDVSCYEQGGETWVAANGRGVSLMTALGLRSSSFQGHIWKITEAETMIPHELRLIQDSDERISLAPAFTMPLSRYLTALRLLNPTLVYFGKKKNGVRSCP